MSSSSPPPLPLIGLMSHPPIWARFLSLTQSKLRLCSANHRAGYFSNLACDWLSIVWAYSEQETENGPWYLCMGSLVIDTKILSALCLIKMAIFYKMLVILTGNFNPFRAKFFRGNINIYLHFVSFLHIQGYDAGSWNRSSNNTRTYLFYIVNIMAAGVLLLTSPGHQQPWYWPS